MTDTSSSAGQPVLLAGERRPAPPGVSTGVGFPPKGSSGQPSSSSAASAGRALDNPAGVGHTTPAPAGPQPCRYAGPGHTCRRRDGRECAPEDCHAEHRAQVVPPLVAQHAFALAAGLDCIPPCGLDAWEVER